MDGLLKGVIFEKTLFQYHTDEKNYIKPIRMIDTNKPPYNFHIGLTMAGAVSAGCYTGGAMDYMFELLALWENAKKGILPEGWDTALLQHIPQHKVEIDVMGGASAGGMTTVMAAIYGINGRINPVKVVDNK